MDQKARQFVQRLLANPALKPLTPLQKEEQIIAFLNINASQLYPTLSSSAFFPGEDWNSISKRLIRALYEITGEGIEKGMQNLFSSRLDLHFFSFLSSSSVMNGDREGQLYQFVHKLLANPFSRRGLSGPYAAIMLKLAHRYIDVIFDDRGYVRFELEKVQRLSMSQEEIKNMVRISMLLRPTVLLLQAGSGGGGGTNGLVTSQFAEKSREALLKQLPFLPEQVADSAMMSNVSFEERSDLPATARLAALFSLLARDYRPGMKVDRGAAGQERSWFGVARKNYRYLGFDMKMVDELYRIATERGW